MVKTSELHRSCTFCCARELGCSGESICKVCRGRSIECVYGLETAKGRPCIHNNSDAAADSRRAVGDSESAAPVTSTNVMDQLDAMFRESFGAERMVVPSNLFQDCGATFNQNLAAGQTRQGASAPAGTLSYPAFLALSTQDLVKTVVAKFGRLDCQPFFSPGERFFRACMLQDTAASMFEHTPSGPSSPDVLGEYSPTLITQHLEVWFSNHPLSILVSKAFPLRDICS
jgi:hypothetical protein